MPRSGTDDALLEVSPSNVAMLGPVMLQRLTGCASNVPHKYSCPQVYAPDSHYEAQVAMLL